MKRLLFALFFFFSAISQINAQDYNSAIGLRGGLGGGFTFRKMISSSEALEGILSVRYGGFSATGLYEIQHEFPSAQRLHWYYGGGAHLGVYQTAKFDTGVTSNESHLYLGIDGIIGMEYNFDFPLNLSVDWKPGFNLLGYGSFIGDGFALSARYYF